MFDADKTRMIVLPCAEKTVTICWAVFIWYRNVTDRRTDGQTDRQICYINISMLTRDKNWTVLNSTVLFRSVQFPAVYWTGDDLQRSATKLADVAGSSQSGHTLGQSTQCLSLDENGRRAATTGDGRRSLSPVQITAENWTELNWTVQFSWVELSWVQFFAVHWV